MPQLLSVFRAARLVGVSRGTLQRKVHDEGTPTFEGKIRIDDLLTLFPNIELQHDSEYERVQHIKNTPSPNAYGNIYYPMPTCWQTESQNWGAISLPPAPI